MGIQFTGLASGLDTQSIIQDLMNVERLKVQSVEKDKTKLEWKKEVWSEMNSKLYSFYKTDLFKFKSNSTYMQKKLTSSTSGIVSLKTSSTAVKGSHSIEISQMAKNSSLTSNKQVTLSGDGSIANLSTKLSDIVDFGAADTRTLGIGVEGASIDAADQVTISKDDTIADLITKVKDLDLEMNLSFDATYGRFFMSSKETGENVQLAIQDVSGNSSDLLKGLGLADNTFVDGGTVLADVGENAIFSYNGTTLESETNEVTVNGISFDITSDSGSTTITVTQDTDTIYNSVKDFVSKYNELMELMNTKLDADPARDYEPLTDDEKEAMTDSEIELWESKIKDSLLRRDSTLTGIRGDIRNTLTVSSGVDTTGLDYQYLSDLGIVTGGYYEGGTLHIEGDEEDNLFSLKDNKLREAIEENPDGVMEFMAKLGSDLYDKMNEKMASSKYSSALTFYQDKAMNEKFEDYDDRIATLEDRLAMVEQRYYKQFTAMEQAIQQSNTTGDWLAQQLSAL